VQTSEEEVVSWRDGFRIWLAKQWVPTRGGTRGMFDQLLACAWRIHCDIGFSP